MSNPELTIMRDADYLVDKILACVRREASSTDDLEYYADVAYNAVLLLMAEMATGDEIDSPEWHASLKENHIAISEFMAKLSGARVGKSVNEIMEAN